MHHTLLLILGLLFAVILLVLLAQRIKIAYPIFLVIAGLGISFIPSVPQLHLDPELIFLIFLPPLLYEAAWYISWIRRLAHVLEHCSKRVLEDSPEGLYSGKRLIR